VLALGRLSPSVSRRLIMLYFHNCVNDRVRWKSLGSVDALLTHKYGIGPPALLQASLVTSSGSTRSWRSNCLVTQGMNGTNVDLTKYDCKLIML